MAYALPRMSLGPVESRVSGGSAARHVPFADIAGFGADVEVLATDSQLRLALAKRNRRRGSDELDWRAQAREYHGIFDEPSGRPPDDTEMYPMAIDDDWGRHYVPVNASTALERPILDRWVP